MEVEPNAKKGKFEDTTKSPDTAILSFAGFEFCKLLKNDLRSKSAFIHSKFKGKDAVIIMEKTAFEANTVQELLTEKTELLKTPNNDVFSTYKAFLDTTLNVMKTELIYPATQQQIAKYSERKFQIVQESPEIYKRATLPYIMKKSSNLEWVYNILKKKKEADRIIFEDTHSESGFILLPDKKWDRKNMNALYLQALVQRRDIFSIRDLDQSHLPLLKNILEKGLSTIREKFGIPASKVRSYLHYLPSYYHLHVHFAHIRLDTPGFEADRAHLLTDVIENIEMKSLYYKEKTLVVKISENITWYTQ